MDAKVYRAYLEIKQPEKVGKGSAIDAAFTWGFNGGKQVGIYRYPRDSQCYAAYCAGRDLKRFNT